MRFPFNGTFQVTQAFGEKITSSFHTGIDYACPEGTEVFAVCDSTVMEVGYDEDGFGNYVIISPIDKVSGILYAHLSEIKVVKEQSLKENDLVGLTGNTGNSTGAHLHIEMRTQWNKTDTYYEPIFDEVISFVPKEITGDTATVVNLNGANLRGSELEWIGIIFQGTVVKFTGEKRTDNGIPRRQVTITGWLAEHDGETQILE